MAKAKLNTSKTTDNEYRTPVTLEAEEAEMISLATKCAKQQLRDGTASSQVIVHYLKLGTTIAKLEKELLIEEAKLKRAKTKSLETDEELVKLYKDAVAAMTSYSPTPDDQEVEDEY